jgi:hypothetical protein
MSAALARASYSTRAKSLKPVAIGGKPGRVRRKAGRASAWVSPLFTASWCAVSESASQSRASGR